LRGYTPGPTGERGQGGGEVVEGMRMGGRGRREKSGKGGEMGNGTLGVGWDFDHCWTIFTSGSLLV